ncbi:unnamed protein product [Parascedosporium putredinis]|uniref:NTF2 domain-containing protein n=1 Tax=Parascedosporium putredinis TaxID=1442378 RepID=A0A9P1MDS1_9PEZI|nr:unnamed protein product [Parascedosporium putredinis]CAI8003175.1 unnamed protein product [Parascedosporium putredinis]
MATINGSFHNQDQYKTSETYTSTSEATEQTQTNSVNHDLSKDEVGWYFVEQYYTTLSKNPDKLHLFYGKPSQFVFGEEAEVANISVGRPAIKDRLKDLDFQECKVRVSNVDALASSHDTILIQVIGETSNKKSEEPRKFVQTFVLAKQPSGYFVLNDIWRYISDDEEEPAAEATQEEVKAAEQPAPTEAPVAAEAAPEEPAAESESSDEETVEEAPALEAETVDKKLEEVAKAESTADTAEETPAETSEAQAAKSETSEAAASRDNASTEVAEEAVKAPEKPKEPAPTPAVPVTKAAPAATPAAAPAPAAAQPEKPAGPPKPMTWASRIAAAAGPARPAPALPKPAAPAAAAQPKTAAAAAAPKAATPAAPAPAAQRAEPAAAAQDSASSGSEWQTAGSDSKRQNRPQSIIAQAEDKGTLGYVKYVTEKVQDADLKNALAQYGALTYFDINRDKNCAFVEFASPTAIRPPSPPTPMSSTARTSLLSSAGPSRPPTVEPSTLQAVVVRLAEVAAAMMAPAPAAKEAPRLPLALRPGAAVVPPLAARDPRRPTLKPVNTYSGFRFNILLQGNR